MTDESVLDAQIAKTLEELAERLSDRLKRGVFGDVDMNAEELDATLNLYYRVTNNLRSM